MSWSLTTNKTHLPLAYPTFLCGTASFTWLSILNLPLSFFSVQEIGLVHFNDTLEICQFHSADLLREYPSIIIDKFHPTIEMRGSIQYGIGEVRKSLSASLAAITLFLHFFTIYDSEVFSKPTNFNKIQIEKAVEKVSTAWRPGIPGLFLLFMKFDDIRLVLLNLASVSQLHMIFFAKIGKDNR